jgi:ATP-grasp domain
MQHGNFIPEKPGAAAPKVLLTDTNRWPTPARLAIGLSKAGCHVSGVCPTRGHPLLHTRVVQQTFPYSSLRPLESLVAAIEVAAPQLIIPCNDLAVQHLHELFRCARSRGTSGSNMVALIERSLGSPDSHPIVSSRYNLLRIAREEGVRVPDTKPINTLDDLKSWQAEQTLPWVLKADGTFGGRGVRIAYSRKQAEQFFLEMNRPHRTTRVIKRLIVNRDPFWLRPWWKRSRPAVIAQSHIQGRPANCAVVCWEGRVLAGIGVEVVSSDGLTGPANVVRIVANPAMLLSAERITRRLGLSGFIGFDFMIEGGSGATYLVEMNPRCTPLSHLQLGKGRDLVGALSAQLSGQRFREMPPVTDKDLIAYFPQAWICNSEFLRSSYQDIPREEPDLVQELLRPWPDRSLLFRLTSKGQGLPTPVAAQEFFKLYLQEID